MERARHHRRQTAHHAGWPSEAFKKRKGNFSTLNLEIIVIVEFSLHILRMPISVIWPRPKLHFVRLRKLYLPSLETCPFILSWLWKWFWALWGTFGHFHFLFKLDFHRFHNLFHFLVFRNMFSIPISNVWTFWRFWFWFLTEKTENHGVYASFCTVDALLMDKKRTDISKGRGNLWI